ncbi:MAG: hypothetical protein NDI91_13550 [Sulfuritalea sp.]|nr:hypothetical protein [Sulfuritalea sp.]
MIKEFALEPDVLASSFRDFTYFTEKFGVAQGRVISRFPKDWKRLVYAAAQARLKGTKELALIEVRLRDLADDVLVAFGRPGGDSSKQWLERAIVEHARQAFSAIIATSNAQSHGDVLTSDDLDETDPRFAAKGQAHINRTAAEIVGWVKPLVINARKVKLIDPHFDPTASRWRRMLKLLLSTMAPVAQAGTTIEIYRSDRIPSQHLNHCFTSAIPPLLVGGIRILVFIRPDAEMHNRFILIDTGGASYQTGLDDNEDGGSTPQDVATWLATDVHRNEWQTYSGGTPFLSFG